MRIFAPRGHIWAIISLGILVGGIWPKAIALGPLHRFEQLLDSRVFAQRNSHASSKNGKNQLLRSGLRYGAQKRVTTPKKSSHGTKQKLPSTKKRSSRQKKEVESIEPKELNTSIKVPSSKRSFSAPGTIKERERVTELASRRHSPLQYKVARGRSLPVTRKQRDHADKEAIVRVHHITPDVESETAIEKAVLADEAATKRKVSELTKDLEAAVVFPEDDRGAYRRSSQRTGPTRPIDSSSLDEGKPRLSGASQQELTASEKAPNRGRQAAGVERGGEWEASADRPTKPNRLSRLFKRNRNDEAAEDQAEVPSRPGMLSRVFRRNRSDAAFEDQAEVPSRPGMLSRVFRRNRSDAAFEDPAQGPANRPGMLSRVFRRNRSDAAFEDQAEVPSRPGMLSRVFRRNRSDAAFEDPAQGPANRPGMLSRVFRRNRSDAAFEDPARGSANRPSMLSRLFRRNRSDAAFEDPAKGHANRPGTLSRLFRRNQRNGKTFTHPKEAYWRKADPEEDDSTVHKKPAISNYRRSHFSSPYKNPKALPPLGNEADVLPPADIFSRPSANRNSIESAKHESRNPNRWSPIHWVSGKGPTNGPMGTSTPAAAESGEGDTWITEYVAPGVAIIKKNFATREEME